VVAEQDGALVGFVTIDDTGYLDQLVVGPAQWGSDVARLLMDQAKRLSPDGVTLKVNADNARAIKFYIRNGFAKTGDEVNSSNRAVDVMEWRP
jgi:putative acetyltransferase